MTSQESVFVARCRCAKCDNRWNEPADFPQLDDVYRCPACGSCDLDIDVATVGYDKEKRPWWGQIDD